MPIPECLAKTIGKWSGVKKVMQHGQPDKSCASILTVASAAKGKFLTLNYTWETDGQPQEGFLLVGAKGGKSIASWVDSWHNGDTIMTLKGEDSTSVVALKGAFPAPPGPDWGWTISLSTHGPQFKMLMTLISPEGQECPAVEAVYQR